MSKPPNQEILDPEGQIPAYNKPGLNPQEFLTSVYQCTTLPMAARIQAAKDVAVYVHARLAQVTQDITAGVTIRIEGGLPELPGTNIIMPDHVKTSSTTKGNGHDPDADDDR
jgi:hypothetical protein